MISRLARIYLLLVGLCLLCCDKGVTMGDWYPEERTILPDPATGDTVELDSEYLMDVEAIANEIIYPVPFDSESRETLEVSELVVEDYVWNEKTQSWIIGIRPIGFSYRGRGGCEHFLFRWFGKGRWERINLFEPDGEDYYLFSLQIPFMELSFDEKELLIVTQVHYSAFEAPYFAHAINLSSGVVRDINSDEVRNLQDYNLNIEFAGWLNNFNPIVIYTFANRNLDAPLWPRLVRVYDLKSLEPIASRSRHPSWLNDETYIEVPDNEWQDMHGCFSIDSAGNLTIDRYRESKEIFIRPTKAMRSRSIRKAYRAEFGKKADAIFSSCVWDGDRNSLILTLTSSPESSPKNRKHLLIELTEKGKWLLIEDSHPDRVGIFGAEIDTALVSPFDESYIVVLNQENENGIREHALFLVDIWSGSVQEIPLPKHVNELVTGHPEIDYLAPLEEDRVIVIISWRNDSNEVISRKAYTWETVATFSFEEI